MAADSVFGPFRPGPGGMPPHLAGREAEQRHFRALLRDLKNAIPPAAEVVLHGPRGNGKTVLLRWLEEEAASVAGIEVAHCTPAEIPDRIRLAEELLPASWWTRFTPSEIAAFGITWRPGDDRPPSARATLDARARKAALLLLLDEAHTLDPAVGRELLNASQEVGRRLPLLLVLAGAPELGAHLNAMNASFWNRAKQFRIGRLSEAATADAFARPLRARGVSASDAMLARMAADSQRYPFFIQLLGQAVWERLEGADGRRAVTPAALEAAAPDFDEAKGEYYLHRLDELRAKRLLPVGRAVAEAFRTRPTLSDPEMDAAVAAGQREAKSPGDALDTIGELKGLGFIWRTRARPEWEPGIPSLMDYIRDHVPPG